MNNEISYYQITNDALILLDKNKRKLKEIGLKNIDNIEILDESELHLKNKSILPRIIAGGLLFGSTGAIIGGISSFIPNVKEIKKSYMIISINNEEIVFSDNKRTLENVKRQIEAVYG